MPPCFPCWRAGEWGWLAISKLELKNRTLKAATYEGKTPDGVPGELLLDFHRALACTAH